MTPLTRIAQWVQNTPSLFKHNAPVWQASPVQNVQMDWPESYQGNPRLGFVYQYIFSQLFSQANNYQLLAEEIQLNQNGKTLGAIDFIVNNLALNQVEHWEIAIKFYLLHEERWYGPSAHDRLDLKLARMLEHQLNMSTSDAFQQAYPQWENISKHLLMQGRLYTNPFANYPIPTTCLAETLCQSRIKGYWCYQHQQHLIEEPLFSLVKHQWITGLETFQTPAEPVSSSHARHYQTATGTFWFIVPDHWPQESG
ncbi:DUF1853 family protein [Vibrio sp. S4M6]|uniref:DUF1853 family protein n=1 Tax=Vibrio sinus TaxID=2946865 RepID=UPI00202A95DD|nr:DUF1853 family protein [Vibrio sinus]MCL9782583.1 DUF1853 family protein [Vibrio sinus]